MSRVNTGLQQRDLTAQANEISEIKKQLGVFDSSPAPSSFSRTPSSAQLATPSTTTEEGGESAPATASAPAPIMVAVRKRPRIKGKEDDQNDVIRCGRNGRDGESDGCTSAEAGGGQITVYAPKMKVDLTPVIEPSNFTFDHVFDDNADNTVVYDMTTKPLLKTVKEGGNAVVFAFGQTGSGKTFTMLGSGSTGRNAGLYAQAIEDVFSIFGDRLNLVVSFYEVYGAKCFDLLNDRNEVRVMQDEYKNVHVVGIAERVIKNPNDMLKLMEGGSVLRSSGTTHANDRSSRSHAVLVLNLRTPKHGALYSCMTFVDLAGSERASDTTDTDKKTRREGAEINKSLLALKECIRAMGMKKKHIPFRGSKLTQILRESFIGKCSTCVIANVSPCHFHSEDTLNTLRYADRIKELKTDTLLDSEPIPCANCGSPIFPGDKHLCRRVVSQCPHCRSTMDKDMLEVHLAECKDAPNPCPHCGSRVAQGDVAKHEKKCMRLPIKCPLCTTLVPRESMPRHQRDHCSMTKVACRYCRAQFPRMEVATHEEECPSMQVVCTKCLMPMKKARLDAHNAECKGGRGETKVPAGNAGAGPNNNNNAKYERAASRGFTSQGGAPNTGRLGAGSGPQAVVQIRNQRSGGLRQSVPPPVVSHFLTSDEGVVNQLARSATAHGSGGHSMSPGRLGKRPNDDQAPSPAPPSVPQIQGFLRHANGKGGATSLSSGRMAAAGGAAEPCPYCGRRILPDAMASHMANDCSYAPMPCSFAKFGCKAKVHKLHITTHMQETMATHLEMVLQYAEDVSRENEDLRFLLSQGGESEPSSSRPNSETRRSVHARGPSLSVDEVGPNGSHSSLGSRPLTRSESPLAGGNGPIVSTPSGGATVVFREA